MISVSGIALKFQKFCMKTTPCRKNQIFLHIASSQTRIKYLGHDQAGGKIKMHGTVGSIIPFLRKMSGKIGNP
jgi:hypothetical protein